MADLKPAILQALSALPAAVTTAHPGREYALPLITVAEDGCAVSEQADGWPYLEEYACSVHIYAGNPQTLESLTAQTDAALTTLGLRRVFRQDLFDEEAYAWHKALRYRAVLHADTLYQ